MIADLLSVYRRDSYCMDYVEKMYKAIDLSYPERYFAGLENLGLLYMDEKCTLYNVEKAAPTLMMVFQAGAKTGGVNLNHPDVLFAYATALTYCTNFIARGMSDTYLDKAAEAGHPKAIRIREEKRRNNKLCLFCGGKFKGLFVKKCSVCGEKKNY